MPERVSQDFPLFPLGIVALPDESVPLHPVVVYAIWYTLSRDQDHPSTRVSEQPG